MNCQKCGQPLANDAQFCGNCGTAVPTAIASSYSQPAASVPPPAVAPEQSPPPNPDAIPSAPVVAKTVKYVRQTAIAAIIVGALKLVITPLAYRALAEQEGSGVWAYAIIDMAFALAILGGGFYLRSTASTKGAKQAIMGLVGISAIIIALSLISRQSAGFLLIVLIALGGQALRELKKLPQT